MNLLELKDKIQAHLIAGYPGLFIHSSEEARVDTLLADVASQLKLSPKEWNLGYGWVDFHNKQPRGNQGDETGLACSLPALLDDDLEHKLFIIKDARSALEHQPLAVARLKQLLNRIQRHHRGKAAVVLVSETLHIPAQIEAQITLLALPLPRGEEISDQLSSVCQQLDLLVAEGMLQRLHAACSGLSQEEIRSALAMVRLQHEQINDAALALIQHEKEQIIAKSGVLEMIRVSEQAADIGGLENLKHWLGRRAQIFRRLADARQARIQAPKGVLIAGMPGCGKSLTAKAAAGLFQLPLLRLDIGSLLGKYVGESEHNMRRALTMAESVSPCILWIDELEKAFVGMNSGSGSEVSSRLFGYFLTWMQEKTGAVFVIATANNITALPPELLRKGRFDEVFYVGFPNANERGAILDIHLKHEALELKAEQRDKLVAQCRDYAGADIQNAIGEARESAFLDSRALTFEDLEAAIDLTVPLRETLREQVGKYEELFEKLKLKPASACEGLSVAQMIKLAEEPNALRRETVACNPDCPDDLLEKLAADPVPAIRTAVYRNPNCPERLLTLRINIEDDHADFDLELLHLACMHPHAPHDLLAAQFETLELDGEQKRQLARKTSDAGLQRQLQGDSDGQVRCALAQNRSLSRELQQLLAGDPVQAVRVELAENPGLSAETQTRLSRDGAFEVREALAGQEALSEEVQALLSQDDDLDVRLALAGNAHLGVAAQLLLARDGNSEVRRTLAGHSALDSACVQVLSGDVEGVLVQLAGNRQLSSALLHMSLSQHPLETVREALAANPQLHGEVQARLLNDSSVDVREALARNENASVDSQEALMRDDSSTVRMRLVRWRDSVLPSVQRHLVDDPEVDVRRYLAGVGDLLEELQQRLLEDEPQVREELAGNRGITAEVQRQLFDRGGPEVRGVLARNSALTGLVQALLAEEPDVQVRSDLAANAGLSAPVADKLLGDVTQVQCALAANGSLSEAHYARLFKAGGEDVRTALAANTNLSEALMAQICQLPVTPSYKESLIVEGGVIGTKAKLALARNCKLPDGLQAVLLTQGQDSPELLQALACNTNLSEATQQALAEHKTAKVRVQLASNDSISYETEHKLLEDSAASVRAALVRDWLMDPQIALRLAEDSAPSVRLALAKVERVPKAAQLILARDPDISVRKRLLERDSGFMNELSRAAQEILAVDSDREIRRLLAAYSKIEASAQMVLAQDSVVSVRETLASGGDGMFGTRLSDEVVQRLLSDDDYSVRLALAGSQRLSPHGQAMIAADPDKDIKLALLEETDLLHRLSIEAQRVLAVDPDSEIRMKLVDKLFGIFPTASNEEVQVLLASDSDPSVPDRLIRNLLWKYNNGTCSAAVKAQLLKHDPALEQKLEQAQRERDLERAEQD